MKYRVRHYTEYSYPDAVSTCYNRLCLTPLNIVGHACTSSEISIVPSPDELTRRTDFFGNNLVFFSVFKEHKRLRVNANSVVQIDRPESVAPQGHGSWQESLARLAMQPECADEVIQYSMPSEYVPYSDVIRDFAQECFADQSTLWDACHALMHKIHKSIEFKPGFTTVNTPVESVIKIKKGVCQDFAHLMITALRNMGVAARYVSGYIETLPPPGKEKMVGADASHAWVSIYFPELGWVEFDPTNNLLPSDKHILVAYGRDYFDVAPIKGIVFNSGEQSLVVKVDVERMEPAAT
jgi:transglutaminase-like putative cysteine protease